ncbi:MULTISPECIES: AraC family transcriptional regulator [Cupriavidus]|uniref:AraC-type DNA-binding protein n=1 Tax=Cupriavidus taiwanensis TaxID=164546 RepID=A0A9Q7XV30_9BURK|nr:MULTISPECIES: AraC family transcriptional regulator [Cupriavidus]MEC3766187.1 AraC family transcriptional regulator ligand-binding domain-containing protein [Cupriavidus sp. SS-3]SPD68157.1 AraC-type DNA-binding protein [Cupriavidus taiwanensis]
MNAHIPGSPVPVPHGMVQRLLDELKRQGVEVPAAGTEPPRPAQFTALYRAAIERLEALVAKGDGHPPMCRQEVDLLCRCVLSCQTLREAIHCAADFCAMLYPRAGALSLGERAGQAVFRMDSLRRVKSSAACLVDLTGLFFYLLLFGWLVGQPIRPTRVSLAHPRREDALPFLGLFHAPVTSGNPAYGFDFDQALLDRPVVRRAAELQAFLKDLPYRLVGAPVEVVSLSQQVRGTLHAALVHGARLPTLAELAVRFDVSEPTLRRRLAADGSSYRQLRERSLQEYAEQCLRTTRWSMGRIAEQLGFASEEAFRRAFQRWTGHAPTQFRRASQGKATG